MLPTASIQFICARMINSVLLDLSSLVHLGGWGFPAPHAKIITTLTTRAFASNATVQTGCPLLL